MNVADCCQVRLRSDVVHDAYNRAMRRRRDLGRIRNRACDIPVCKAASDGGVFSIFLGALSIAAAGELSVTEVL